MAKKDHKGIASDLVKGFINNPTTPPMQKFEGGEVVPVSEKKETHKFTAEFDADLMQSVKIYAINKKKKIKPLLEEAIKEYMNNHP
jgi:hypothetical protein